MDGFLFLGQPSEYFTFGFQILGTIASTVIAALVAYMQYNSHRLEVEKKKEEKIKSYFILHDAVVSFNVKLKSIYSSTNNSLLTLTQDETKSFIGDSKEELIRELDDLAGIIDKIDAYKSSINSSGYTKEINLMIKDINSICHKLIVDASYVNGCRNVLEERSGEVTFALITRQAIIAINDGEYKLSEALTELESVVWGGYESLTSES